MAPTQSRRSYTAGFKLEVIAFAEQNGGNMAAERKFGVTEKVIRGWRKQKDALQRTKKSRKSFRGRVAKKTLIPEGNLEKFVVVKRKAARGGVDIVYDFQSTEAPKKETEWNVQSEVLEREPNCDFHHAETPEMEPIRVLQSLNSLERCPNCDFQSAEVKEREPIRDLQTAVSLKKELKWDFQSTEVQETENNSHAVFQSVEAHNRLNSQVGNKGTKMPTKKSRKSYTAGFKLEVIAFAEKNGGNMAAERKFGVAEKVIRDWRKQKTALQQTKKSKKSFRGHSAQWPDLEDKLEEYVKEQRAASRDLSAIKIRLKAREIAKEMQIHNFEGNASWCFRFMRRKNIVLRQCKNHSKEKDVFLLQTNSSCESFQGSVAKRQELDGNLEKFVVVNTEAASSYTDTVQEFQSAEAPKLEPDWEVRLAEGPEMEPYCDIQSTEAQKMEPVLDLQSNDSLERDPMNCDLQSAEALKREADSSWDVQLIKASKMEPNYVVKSNERQKLEPVLDLQSIDSLKRDNNCEFQNSETPERVCVWELQSFDSSESEINCGFQSFVTEAPPRESTRDFQTADKPVMEPKRDFCSTQKQKRIPNSQVGNTDQITSTTKTRKSYTAGFKLEVIAFAEKNGGNRAAERKFGVGERAIRGWRKQKTALQQTKKSKKSFRGLAAQWPVLEDKLEEYIKEQRAASRDLSATKIRLKAREIAKEMQIHNFEGCKSWCFRFMRRKNIVLRQCKNHSKEKDVFSQQINSSSESFQGSVAKRQVLDGNLEKFVVVKTEAASSYTDTVQEFQSAEAPKMEPDWEVRLAEEPEMEPNCDTQSTEPNYVVKSNERQKLEPVLDLQSNDSLEWGNNCEFQNAETPERVRIWDLQSFDSPECEPNCGFQSFVTEARQMESTRDFQTAVEQEIEPKRDFCSTQKQKRTPYSQAGNKDQKTPTMKTHKSYTAGFKLNVIAFAEENGGNRAAERKFGVTEKAIRGWRKQKMALQQTKKSRKSFRRLAAQWPDLEDRLEEYVIEQRAASRGLSATKIRLKAREMAKEMQIHNFEGGASWCFRFMRRKNIVLRQCRNHFKEKDVFLQQTNSSYESFQGSVAKRQVLEGNLEKFVVVNTEAASSYTDTVQEFQSADAPKLEPDWEVRLAEEPEMEPYCDIQSTEAQKMEPVLDLQSNDSLERDLMNCDLQSAEALKREADSGWDVQLRKEPKIEPNYVVESTERQKLERVLDLQSNDSLERSNNCEFQNAETPERESTRDFQTAVKLDIEPKRDFCSTEEHERTNSQVRNTDQKTPTMKMRKSYTAGFKLEVIAFAEKNGGNRAAERKFGVGERAIRGWRKQKTALQQTKKSKKSFRGLAAQWPDLEDKLEEYVIEQRAASRDLSATKIRLKAREMAKEMQIHNFEGSASWCYRFMRRKNIVLRQRRNHSKDLSIQSIDSAENEPTCDILSVVSEAPQRESTRDFQAAVLPGKELQRDFHTTEEQKRTNNNQVGNKDPKTVIIKPRKSYTAGFKLEVIAFAEENGGNKAAEKKFGVSEKNIRGWRKQKLALQQAEKSKKSFRGHSAQWPDLEDKLEKYIMEQRAAKRDLNGVKIRLKAREMAREMQIHNFEGTASWCFRFMKRKNIVLRHCKIATKDPEVSP